MLELIDFLGIFIVMFLAFFIATFLIFSILSKALPKMVELFGKAFSKQLFNQSRAQKGGKAKAANAAAPEGMGGMLMQFLGTEAGQKILASFIQPQQQAPSQQQYYPPGYGGNR